MNNITPNNTTSLQSWLCYIENLHDKTIELGLDRIYNIAKYLNILKPANFIFTVTGTNGKGTTCHTLETLLISANYRVGLYSSPHLLKYTERIRIQGKELNEKMHTESFSIIESARSRTPLTYFEFSTLSALFLFKQAHLDIVILEVGLGGRLDATNIIDSDIAIITNIGIDHTDLLGTTRASIGYEKAGIFRYGRPAIIGESDIPYTIEKAARKKNVLLLQYKHQWSFKKNPYYWCFYDLNGQLDYLPLIKIPLINAATALAALRVSGLKLDIQLIYSCLPTITLPGRFQIIQKQKAPVIILDVAHNPHASEYLATRISNYLSKYTRLFAIVGMLKDKNISGTLAPLLSKVDKWYCITLDVPRGADVNQLISYLPQGSEKCSSIEEAWSKVNQKAKLQDIILCFGSFHTVAKILKLLNR
ncbi:bifunctional tetrahydrofolate synthase/dihydrofolate synthase [Candidatus Ishikawella capsulata]|uniref:Dihydrofolate synthase/folylpolyglutamate synthase n=1 Tax=Candidatus Ishikawaella capsulata Mpkobe TaxID=476281 RepID=C5WC53_9ENTR|nr:bifunctional tetrahydrofolate synthase/dihydrofolate synthase [Candidatus Ishikawaella capsulata]BAH82909.1 bifunctional folylpolyglutamate synthase/ dihydrofolate synthase [Candidatus Ishikawaella capsulata Mpkobe]